MNSSPSTISPDWPTRWPQDSFRFGPTAIVVLAALGAMVPFVIGGALWLAPMMRQGLSVAELVVPSLVVQIAVEVAILAVILIGLPRISHMTYAQLGFTAIKPWQVLLAIAGAFVMIVVVNGGASLYETLTHTKHEQNVVEIFRSIKQPGTLWFFALFAIVIAPIAEETIFRIFVFNVGLRWGGFWLGSIASGLLFGAAHMDAVAFLPLALGGVVLCAVYYRTRCAYASMITHALFNATTIAALIYAPQLAQ